MCRRYSIQSYQRKLKTLSEDFVWQYDSTIFLWLYTTKLHQIIEVLFTIFQFSILISHHSQVVLQCIVAQTKTKQRLESGTQCPSNQITATLSFVYTMLHKTSTCLYMRLQYTFLTAADVKRLWTHCFPHRYLCKWKGSSFIVCCVLCKVSRIVSNLCDCFPAAREPLSSYVEVMFRPTFHILVA